MRRFALFFIVSLTLLSCGANETDMPITWNDDALADDLRILASQRVFFGHQSVGANIVGGVRELSALHPDVPLAVVDPESARTMSGPFFAESLIGRTPTRLPNAPRSRIFWQDSVPLALILPS